MSDEWWSSARTAADDGGSPSSTALPTDQQLDAAETVAATTTSTTNSIDFRPTLLHVHHAAAPPPSPSFLADPAPHHTDWMTTQAYMGGRAPPAATTSFNALLQLHGDTAGVHFLLRHDQQLHADGAAAAAAPVAEASSMSYAGGNQPYYSSYGDDDVPAAAALMTTKPPPFSQLEFFGSSWTRNLGDMMPAAPAAPPMATKPLFLQALEQKAFKSQKEPTQDDACSSATRSVPSRPSTPAPAKKARVATPSPLPAFKVRKEKLGDRITALQQLVSPFGKTDTASVLHEAIEYIRFLHDQVASLSSPYLRCGRPVHQLHQQQAKDDGGGEGKEGLRSRGLCLVPVASTTYAVATSETAPEFWPPTFGGTLR